MVFWISCYTITCITVTVVSPVMKEIYKDTIQQLRGSIMAMWCRNYLYCTISGSSNPIHHHKDRSLQKNGMDVIAE